MRIRRFFLAAAALVASTVAAGCNDTTGLGDWVASADTVTLYSASRPELSGQQSGFDFSTPRPVIVESYGTGGAFDMVLTDRAGSFLLVPSGAITAEDNRAGLAKVNVSSLESIREAPKDTAAFQQKAPVPVQPGDFFVVRSRRVSCLFSTGSYYAKLQIVAVDPGAGTLRFAFVRNPFCSNQALVPPGS